MQIARRGSATHFAALLFFLSFAIASHAQKIIHVPADVPNIQIAIFNANNGDTVLVSPGTYFGGINFVGKAITVQSTDGAAVTTIDGQGSQSAVMFNNGEGPQSALRGFTVMNGFSFQGGGIQIFNASPTIENNIITGNTGCNGAGISADTGSAAIRNNTISNNLSTCPAGDGAGVYINGPGSVQLASNTITGNQLGFGGDGGGVFVDGVSTPVISGNAIENNSSTSGNGGGLAIAGTALVTNNVIDRNSAMFNGGGTYTVLNGSQPSFVNNTIAGNSAGQGAQFYIDGADAGIEIANNLLIDFNGAGAVFCGASSGQIPLFDHNDVYSSSVATGQVLPYGGACADMTGVSGNIQADPQFLDPVSGNFHLQLSSPALDSGNNTAPNLPTTDLEGNTRVAASNAATCVGTVDLGAYEIVTPSTGTGFLSPSNLNFGQAFIGAPPNGSQSLTLFANQGCVQVASIHTSSDFQQTNNCGALVPGNSCTIQVTFSPVAPGFRSGALQVNLGPGLMPLGATLTGQAVNSGFVTPTSLDFGSQPVGTTSFTNGIGVLGDFNANPLEVTAVSVTGDFAALGSCSVFSNNCFLPLTFTPTAPGLRTGVAIITSNQGVFTVPLSGTGLGAVASVSPASLVFASQTIGTVSQGQTITLSNAGTSDLLINAVIPPFGFQVQPVTCFGTVPAGGSCSYQVMSNPFSVGDTSGTLEIDTNGGNITVALTASGTPPIAGLSPQVLTFAATPIGSASAGQSVAVTNISGAPLQLISISAPNNFLALSSCPAVLNPGAGCSIDVSFVPNNFGPYNGFLTVATTLGNVTAVLTAGDGHNTFHVPADFPNISAAIAAAQNGDTILVSPGTYFEQVNFQGKAITLASTGGPGVTIIDGQNFFVPVEMFNNEPPQAVLRGFTITHGSGNGIKLFGASPTIEGNIITNNTACNSQGGIGIALFSSQAVVRHNTISNNVDTCNGSGQGGGIAVLGNNNQPGRTQILNNIITGNQTSPIGGGGIAVNFNGVVLIQGNTIENNSTSGNGGGILVTGGSNADIVENVIAGNFAGSGGGIYETVDFFGQSPLLLNNTVANNTSSTPGTAIYIDGVDAGVTLVNNILIDATGFGAVTCGATNGQAPSFTLNDILSLVPGAPAYNGTCPDATGINGNIKQDPQFVDPAANNYHLQPSSPAIDVGMILPGSTPDQDLDGKGRIGPGNALSCLGAIDLGAYEFALSNSGTPFLPPQFDLGNGTVGASTIFTLTMPVSGCVQLASIKTTGDFQQNNFCGGAVSSSLGCNVNVTFAPTAAGPRTGSLKFDFGTSSPAQTVTLTGTGFLAAMNTSPAILNFGNQNVQTTSAAQTVFVFSSFFDPSTPLMRVNGVWISGDFAQTNTCGFTSAGCTFTVTFTPTASGPRQGSLVVSTNQGLATISLSGNGVSPVAATLTPSALSFSNQLVNTVSPAQLATLTNTGTSSFLPGAVTVTGDFTVNTSQCGSGLAPGASCSYAISFKPGTTGPQTGVFTVSVGGTPLSVTLSGTGVAPQATFSPQSLTFANQVVNTSSAAQTLALANTGTAALSLTGITVTGDFSQSNNCTASLAPGAGCNINVSFTPTVVGSRSGVLTVLSNAGNFSVPLSGAGFNAVATVTPSTLSFGTGLLNTTTRPQSVTLMAGINPLQIAAIAVSGDFSQTNSCGASLGSGASCTIQLTFTPTAEGVRSGALTISSNESTLSASLSGNGLARAQNTIYVPVDQSTIQAAIAAAIDGQSVLVLPGTYIENLNFNGKAITVTSTDGPAATIVDGGGLGPVVTFKTNEGANSVLNGFTLQNGSPSHTFPATGTSGGGIWIFLASPTITNNLITRNHAICGIGIEIFSGSAVIRGNTITANTQAGGSGGCGGGGIEVTGDSSHPVATPQIIGNTITNNSMPAGADGGGIAVNFFASPTIQNNYIAGNAVFNSGGGVFLQSSTGIPVVVTQNIIVNNSAGGGGSGGGIAVSSSALVVNNTVVGNAAFDGSSGIFADRFSPATISNNIVVAVSGQTGIACSPFSSTFPVFSHNDVTSPGGGQAFSSNCAGAALGNGNISLDPEFVNAAANDYHLQAGSPAIDAGDNAAPNLPALDLDGNPRVAFGSPATCSNTVDIGVYEFALQTAPLASLSPAALDFGIQPVGTTSASQSFTLTATQGCVTTQSIATTGDFSQTNNCSSTLATGASCTVQVSFTPSLGGLRTGSLAVTGNTGTLTSSLSGQGGVATAAFSPVSLSFGDQLVQSSSAAQTVTLTSSGNLPLQISGISISGPFSQTNNCPATLAPATSCSIAVIFSPTAAGAVSGFLNVSSNSSSVTNSVPLSGIGIAPAPVFTPSALNFGNVRVRTTATQTLTLSNNGTAPLILNGLNLSGSSDFTQTNTCPASLGIGQSCTVSVIFTPSSRGSRSATLSLNTTQPFNTTASLSGVGVAPVAVFTSSLTFPSQNVGTSSSQTATLANNGDAALDISAVSITGDFSAASSCPAALAPATSCSIQVTFTPSAAGIRSGSLVVTDDDPAAGQQTIALSGTGVDYSVTASPGSVSVKSGQTAVYTATITALGGNFAGSVSLSCGGLPAGANCSFSPASVAPGAGSASSTLNLTTSNGGHGTKKTPTGTYTITITGSSVPLQHSTTVKLVVQ